MKILCKSLFLILINLITLLTSAQTQDYIIKGTTTHQTSSIYELSTGSFTKLGIGFITPNARVHIKYNPSDVSPLFSVEAINQISTIGNIENWSYHNNILYGIYQTGQSGHKNYLQNSLGIGIENPTNQLDVNGTIGCIGSNTGIAIQNGNVPFVFSYVASSGNFDVGIDPPPVDSMRYPLKIHSWGISVKSILESSTIKIKNFNLDTNAGTGSVLMSRDLYGNGIWTRPDVFSITEDRVGIGEVNTFSDYRLAVNGKILCTELKVKLRSQWPDDVFSPDYKMPSIGALDNYVRKNRHLPDVPTAKEVEKDGINIGEMNAILLKKVEELTLYIIAMQKEVEQLKAKISNR